MALGKHVFLEQCVDFCCQIAEYMCFVIIYEVIFLSGSCEQNIMKQSSYEAQKAGYRDQP